MNGFAGGGGHGGHGHHGGGGRGRGGWGGGWYGPGWPQYWDYAPVEYVVTDETPLSAIIEYVRGTEPAPWPVSSLAQRQFNSGDTAGAKLTLVKALGPDRFASLSRSLSGLGATPMSWYQAQTPTTKALVIGAAAAALLFVLV